MDNKDNTQVFSLEEIMREFGADIPDAEPAAQDSAAEAEIPAPEMPELTAATIRMEPLAESAPEESTEEAPADPPVMPEAEEAAEEPEGTQEPAAQEEAPPAEPLSEAEEAAPEAEAESPAPAEEPLPEESLPEEPSEETAQPPEEAAVQSEEPAPEPRVQELPPEQIPAPKAIPFRSRLGELKRQLVAGPEKRYYDLSEIGLGRVQIAIFLSLLVVVLCAGATGLYAMGLVLENRLRLMIFSQILAMMISALLGCYVLMDGIADLFKGRFSLNTMLFLTLGFCAADAVFCLQELRVPCCAAFSLEMTFALWNRSLRRSTEIGQMDTLRKATRLGGIVKADGFFGSHAAYVRTEGRLEDFMDNYSKPTGPEKTLNIFALLSVLVCVGIGILAGLRHGLSLAIQVCATSMLVAVPAGTFISQSRPAAILERRLHMFGTVLCGWKGVKKLCGKASFPLHDRDIFPLGATKLNGVKFLNDQDPDTIIACAATLMQNVGGSLEGVFTQLLKSRSGRLLPLEEPRMEEDGIIGRIYDQEVFLGSAAMMERSGITIPENARVENAVYCALGDTLAAVFAISYSRTKAAAGGLVSLNGSRRVRPLVLCRDFLITPELIRSKFGLRAKRFDFPPREYREELAAAQPDPELPCCALTTQVNLAASVYAVTGARALRTASRLGAFIHLTAGILGLLIMAALAYLGDVELLSPFNVLMYEVIWLVPGLIITEWTRTV